MGEKVEMVRGLIERLPAAERDAARIALGPSSALGPVEAVCVRLAGPILGGDAVAEWLAERIAHLGDSPPQSAICPVCGQPGTFKEVRSRTLQSTAGEIRYERAIYRCRQCADFVPIDERLGVEPGQKQSPRLRELSERFGTDLSFSEVAVLLDELVMVTTTAPSVRHTVNLTGQRAHQIAAEAAQQARPGSGVTLLPELRQPAIGATDTLVIVPDGTGIPMRSGSSSEAKVAVLFLLRDRIVDAGGRERLLHTREVAYLGHWEPFADRLYAAALRMGLRQVGRVVLIGDCGNWIDSMHAEYFPEAIRIADIWHVLEYLAAAARSVMGEGDASKAARDRWLRARRTQLKAGQIDSVLAALRNLCPANSRPEAVRDALRYLGNHRSKMAYDEYAAMGVPIGSGSVEGRCKTLIGNRFKRGGARWNPASAAHLLALRVAYRTGRWHDIYPHSTLRHPTPPNRHKLAS